MKPNHGSSKNEVKLGLKQNRVQFALLVLVNAFVGGMVGIERTIFPKFAQMQFGVESATAILSFIAAFGLSKAIANYFTGKLANRWGRRNLLIWGWMIALPVPFILIYAKLWAWVVVANVLLGISQGLTWSSTVVMKIDLVGDKDRGFAMGINEFAGYFAVGLFSFLSSVLADKFGVTPFPFYLGIIVAVLGFFLSVIWVKDTRAFVHRESHLTMQTQKAKNVFLFTSFKDKTLSSVTQAGLVNNLNDGMIWGLLPMYLAAEGLNSYSIGWIASVYPMVWGVSQLFTGKMSDHFSKKKMLFGGMFIQAVAIILLVFVNSFSYWMFLLTALGLGTALVYPTFLSTIAEVAHPQQRAESIGVFRLWRDLGYVVGAILSGVIADALGIEFAIACVGGITLISAIAIKVRMPLKNGQVELFTENSVVLISLKP